jgi:hypothetical protein
MKQSLINVSLAASAAVGALLLSGCVVAPAPYYGDGSAGYPAAGYGDGYGDAAVYAPTAPPAPYAEVQPAIPFAGAIWIGGFWNWSGDRYSWVPGRYERPRAGYQWEQRRWTQGSRGWQLQGGWRNNNSNQRDNRRPNNQRDDRRFERQ